MKATPITEINSRFFLSEVPESIQSEADFFLGAETDDGIACGVTAFEVRDGILLVIYAYVAPDYRGKGALREMLSLAKTWCEKNKVYMIASSYELDGDTGDFDESLDHLGFRRLNESGEGNLFRIPLQELYSNLPKAESKDDIYSFKDLTLRSFSAIRKVMKENLSKDGIRSVPVFHEKEWYEPDLSFACFDDKKTATGCVLVKAYSDSLVSVEYVYNEGSNVKRLLSMLRKAAEAAMQKYKADTLVQMQAGSNEGRDLISKLSGKHQEAAGIVVTRYSVLF